MAEKNIASRIIHKHDTEINWNKSSFIPKQGELIIYDKDSTYDYERFKIGDGIQNVNLLPFANDTKVDKVDGKQLSTNDYTTEEKNKLAGIEDGANKTVVDDALSTTSENPVQNKIVTTEINGIKTLIGDTPVSEQITDAVKDLSDKKSLTINSVIVSSTNTINVNNYVTPGEWIMEADDSLTTIWNGVLNAPYNSEASDTIPAHHTFKLICEKWNISHQNTTYMPEGYTNFMQKIIDQDGCVYYRFIELIANPEVGGSYLRQFWGWYIAPALSIPTSNDNGKILQVVNGQWQAVAITNAEGVEY